MSEQQPQRAFDFIRELPPGLHRFFSASLAALATFALLATTPRSALLPTLLVFVAVLCVNPDTFSVLQLFVDLDTGKR